VPVQTNFDIIYQYVSSTNWLASGFLVTIALGIFAGLNGIKAGWLGAISAGAALMLQSALTVVWVYWVLGFLLIAVVLLCIASIIKKKCAIWDLVNGIQIVRDGYPDMEKRITAGVSAVQNKDTRGLVLDIKAQMKKKGWL